MVVIHKGDSEEVRVDKRKTNQREMAKEHQRGAEKLPLGLPKNCKVVQKIDRKDYNGKQGSLCWRAGGNLRIQYINGRNGKEYKMGFAGRARTTGEMNGGEDELHQRG